MKYQQDRNKLYNVLLNRVVPIIKEWGTDCVKLIIPEWLDLGRSEKVGILKQNINHIEIIVTHWFKNKLESFVIKISPEEFCSIVSEA